MIFKNNAVQFYILTILNGVVPLIAISFLSRMLNSEQFGTYLLSFTIMNVLGMIVDFGFSISGVRTLSNNNLGMSDNSFVLISYFIKTVIFFVVSIFYYFFYLYSTSWNADFYLITILGIFLTGLDSIWILQVNGIISKIIIRNIVANIIYISFVFLIGYLTKNYAAVLWVFIVYKFYLFIISLKEVSKKYIMSGVIVSRENVKFVIKSTVGIAVFRFFALSYTAANGILLNFLTNKYQVALYLAFEKLNKLILFVATPVTQALLPLFTGGVKHHSLAKYVMLIIAVSGLGLMIGNWLSSDIIAILIGNAYVNENTSKLFFFMTIISPFILISNAIGMLYFIPNKLDKILNYIVCCAALINVTLVLYFVHSELNGALQMAIIVAFSEFLVMLAMVVVRYVHRKNYGK